jgi:hypothetical protein
LCLINVSRLYFFEKKEGVLLGNVFDLSYF